MALALRGHTSIPCNATQFFGMLVWPNCDRLPSQRCSFCVLFLFSVSWKEHAAKKSWTTKNNNNNYQEVNSRFFMLIFLGRHTLFSTHNTVFIFRATLRLGAVLTWSGGRGSLGFFILFTVFPRFSLGFFLLSSCIVGGSLMEVCVRTIRRSAKPAIVKSLPTMFCLSVLFLSNCARIFNLCRAINSSWLFWTLTIGNSAERCASLGNFCLKRGWNHVCRHFFSYLCQIWICVGWNYASATAGWDYVCFCIWLVAVR